MRQTEKDIINETADDYASEFFKDLRTVYDCNGDRVTADDFAAVIAQAIDCYTQGKRV